MYLYVYIYVSVWQGSSITQKLENLFEKIYLAYAVTEWRREIEPILWDSKHKIERIKHGSLSMARISIRNIDKP